MKNIIKKQIRNKSYQVKAFTMIESLIVLSMISLITFLFYIPVSNIKNHIKETLFFLHFETFYKDTQISAVLEQKDNYIHIKNRKIRNENSSIKIPETVTIIDMKPIYFDSQGGNSSLKKLTFQTTEREVKYQLY